MSLKGKVLLGMTNPLKRPQTSSHGLLQQSFGDPRQCKRRCPDPHSAPKLGRNQGPSTSFDNLFRKICRPRDMRHSLTVARNLRFCFVGAEAYCSRIEDHRKATDGKRSKAGSRVPPQRDGRLFYAHSGAETLQPCGPRCIPERSSLPHTHIHDGEANSHEVYIRLCITRPDAVTLLLATSREALDQAVAQSPRGSRVFSGTWLFLDTPATPSPSWSVKVGQLMTMASDCGSSGSSELDDEPSRGRVDEWDSIIALDAKNVAGDPESISQDSPEEETPRLVTVTARAYQIEMLEESLKRNIIVAVCRPPRIIVADAPR